MKGLTPHPKDLHVLGISEKDFVRRGIRTMLFAVLLALCMFALVTYSMGATPILLILFLLLFPVAVWIHMVRGIEVKATARRSDMDIAVAVFLDLVNVLLAGGAGAETALLAAAPISINVKTIKKRLLRDALRFTKSRLHQLFPSIAMKVC